MKSIVETLKSRFVQALEDAFPNALNGSAKETIDQGIVNATNPSFGDFQCNAAMSLSKKLGKPPRKVAEELVAKLNLSDVCEPPEIAGPGFINLRLQKTPIEKKINAIKTDARLGIAKVKPRNYVVDMSSPNIAKEMHVGHLRSTIIGDSLARVYEFLGHNVLRLNHVGDWGTQFGMLITYLKEVCPQALSTADAIDLGDLVAFYKQAKKRFDEDEVFQQTSRQEVVQLQSGNKETLHAWNLLCNQSRREFQVIYDLLDVKLIERGESFYNNMLADVVTDLEKTGLLVEDQGAKCVFVPGFTNQEGNPLPLIIQKKDGGYNYATTDLASIRYRLNHDKGTNLVYVVDAGQSDHFAQVFQVAKMAGWVPDGIKIDHVPFGVVQGEDGKKLKTRSGETVRLKDLIDEAITAAHDELDTRIQAENRSESEEFKNAVAQAIGIGAIKYADLSTNRLTNYVFSFKRMLSMQGNTAPYLMYAYVRVKGIGRKGGIDLSNLGDVSVQLNEEAELTLAKHLLRLEDTLESMADEFLPNRLCQYLFELSQKFNQFYDTCPVLSAEEPVRTSRLILSDITARTIKLGLSLLGINVLERM